MLDKKDNNKMQQSPLKEREIGQLEETKKDVINQLDYLFTYYASKFSRHNYRQLSHKSYMDMMERLLVRSDNLLNTRTSQEKRVEQDQLRKVEILYFSKGCKEGATFQQFLELIPGLAHIIYPELKNKVQQSEMMTKDLLNLYRREVEIKLTGKFIDLDLALEQETVRYILKLAPEFLKIYKAYFYHEINRNIKKESVKDESMKCFFKFIKEFEVFPKLITAGGICFIYKQVLDSPQTQILDQELKDTLPIEEYKNNTGMVFSLGKFITTLVAISKVTNQKIKSSQDGEQLQKDCLRSLLEYIEMTKAYKKQRHLKDTGKSFSFILLEEYPKQLLKQTKALKEGKEVTPKKESQFLRILKKMEI